MKSTLVQKIQKIHYLPSPPLFWAVLAGVGALCYLLIVSFKNFFYNLGILREEKVGAKVICVGNLTTGGVGKTPIVCALVNYLVSKGLNVAVISRGYGGKLCNKQVNVIKDYEKILINDPFQCGDEPYLLAKNTFGAIVLTSADRVLAAKTAIERFKTEVIILDDGFSNRKIYKDINILTIDSEKGFGNNCVLPLGPLREPLCEIKRANKLVVVEKNASQKAKLPLEHYNIPITACKMAKDGYYNPIAGDVFIPNGQKAFAFCAIGRPEQFWAYLENDFNLVGTYSFNDHHSYSKKDLETLGARAIKTGADVLLTTEKDIVKLKEHLGAYKNIIVLKLKPQLDLESLTT